MAFDETIIGAVSTNLRSFNTYGAYWPGKSFDGEVLFCRTIQSTFMTTLIRTLQIAQKRLSGNKPMGKTSVRAAG